MKYSMGETLADYGFSFFEKLHSPLFLLHRNGSVKKINEAGRKLLSVGHITAIELDRITTELLGLCLGPQQVEVHRQRTCRKELKVISKQLGSSDYVLVELIR